MRLSKRHIAKSISWRLIGTIDTFIFAWLITGDIQEGLNLSGITTVTKFIWYYIHERYWFSLPFPNTNKRHIIKTFSWRVLAQLIHSFWLVLTGNPFTGLKIGGVEIISKMILYFGHEKLWYKINFGLDKRNKAKRLKKIKEKRNRKN